MNSDSRNKSQGLIGQLYTLGIEILGMEILGAIYK